MSLLLQYWDVEGGKILVDGQDINAVSRASLRAAFAEGGVDAALLYEVQHLE
jgi:ABC-type multidrug transport system fused ATPase/permease subunit